MRLTIQQPALPRYRVPVFRALARRDGIDLHLVYGNAPDAPANAAPSGFSGQFVPIRRLLRSAALWHQPMLTYATRRRSDVLVLTWDLHYLSLIPALLLARCTGVRTVLWGHGFSKHEVAWRGFLRRSVGRLADELLFYNHSAADPFVDKWKWDRQRIHVALNSLDQTQVNQARSQWADQPERLAAFQREKGLDDRPVVLFVSRLQPENRVDLLLQAASRLARNHPRLRVVIIGRGDDLPRLQSMQYKLGLADHVIFAGALYNEEQLAPYFLSSNVFCYPANVGLSLLHGFGYGLPVVTSDRIQSQNPEIEALVHGENGLLYRDGDPDELARALAVLIENPKVARQMGAQGRQVVEERFTLTRMVDGIERAVQAAFGARHGADAPSQPPPSSSAAPVPPPVAQPPAVASEGNGPSPIVPLIDFKAAPDLPNFAIVANAHTPYRVHLHRRIVNEMPEVRLWSIFTHETSNAPWTFAAPPEIRPLLFGEGESTADQDEPRYVMREWRKGGRIIQWLKHNRVRAVVMLGYNDPGRLRIIRWCHRNGVACLLWGDSNIRGDTARGLRRWIKNRLIPRVLRRCDAVLPCGSLGRDYFLRYGADPKKIFYFPYEPDYDLIRLLPAERIEQTRAKFDLAPDRRRIVFSGRLVNVKRCDLLIDAFVTIAAERPEWDVVIVGDGPLRAALQGRVPAALRSRVTWTGFFPHQKDVAAVYRLSDVLVLPSDHEPWALVINEAAAAGLAIVCTDVVGAAAELVREGFNGYTFKPGDLTALTRCLLQTTDPTRIDAMKAASLTVLADWCERGDPVTGLRQSLTHVGVIERAGAAPATVGSTALA